MLEIKNLSKVYKTKNNVVKALDHINLKIQDKGMVFILGKSGSGKSTLLNVLGGLDQFDEGEIIIHGKSSRDFNQSDFDSYRNTFIGFIFQEYNVMDNFTVKENINLALQLQGKKESPKVVQNILKQVDLETLGDRKPNELSGGQLQRVAIARALIKNPEIIMADEPTGALDSRTGKQIFDTLKELSQNKLVLIVSHDKEFAKNYADRIIELEDGKIISDTSKENILPKQINKGISYLENEFINIQNSQQLSQEDIEKIIHELKNHEGETIISFNQNTNNEIKKTNHINENGQIEVFYNTTDKHLGIKDIANRTISFIKSKLPLKSSMKIALSNLKLKPFRLFMTILLSVVSFTLFGLTNTLSEYKKETATFQSMKDSQIDYISIGKTSRVYYDDNYFYDEESKLTDQDIQMFQKKYPQLSLIKTFSSNNYGTNLDLSAHIHDLDKISDDTSAIFYPTSLSSLGQINNQTIKDNNFTLTGKLPQNDNEIVITEFLAQTFRDFNYQTTDDSGNIQTSKDLIGKSLNITINDQNIKMQICGILDTHIDLSRYEQLKDEHNEGISQYYLMNELETLITNGYHCIGFVSDDRLQNSIDGYHVYSAQALGNSFNLSKDEEYYDTPYFYGYDDIDPAQLVDFNNNGSVYLDYLTIQDIQINNTTLRALVNDKITDPTNEKEVKKAIQETVLEHKNEIVNSNFILSLYTSEKDIDNIIDKIAGVYINPSATQMTFVLKDNLIQKYHIEKEGYAHSIIAPMSDDKTLQDIIAYTYDDGIKDTSYTLNNQVMPMLTTVNSIIETLEGIFLYIGIGFAIFAAVMFCNFIATSIANKQREIGILRAVGARSLDVLKIFSNESLIIAFINWLLTCIACFVSTLLINQFIRKEFGVLVTILNFGLLQIILVFLISITVAIIASALPVYKISRKKPIDAIKNRK